MEDVSVAVVAEDIACEKSKLEGKNGGQKNRIQVSNTKKPFLFYLNLAKKYIKLHNDVELSALGMAIPTVVTISEILKSKGLAIEKQIRTSAVGSREDAKGRMFQKARIEILLGKNEDFGNLNTAVMKSNPASEKSDE